jgi:LPS-assembly lipoprotein
MWWREKSPSPGFAGRGMLFVLLALPLAACGFHPLYGGRPGLSYDPALAAIDVRPAPDRVGQITTDEVRNELNPRGVAANKRYVLSVSIVQQRSDLGIRRDNTSSRGELLMNATLELTPAGGGKAVYEDQVRTITAFNLSNDAYAASVAEDNARREAATDLGREIALRVQLFVQRQARGGT